MLRWSEGIKREIKRSRAETTRKLAEAINALPAGSRPALVSSSAVGFYGTSEGDTYNEDSPSGSDFLAQVCQDWEREANAADTRVAIIRTGIVMSKQGGALAKLLPVFALFLGAVLLHMHGAHGLRDVADHTWSISLWSAVVQLLPGQRLAGIVRRGQTLPHGKHVQQSGGDAIPFPPTQAPQPMPGRGWSTLQGLVCCTCGRCDPTVRRGRVRGGCLPR